MSLTARLPVRVMGFSKLRTGPSLYCLLGILPLWEKLGRGAMVESPTGSSLPPLSGTCVVNRHGRRSYTSEIKFTEGLIH